MSRTLWAVLLALLSAGVLATAALAPIASAAETAAPGWAITSFARPTNFSSSDYADEVNDVTIKAAGGTFTLSLKGQDTTSLACNAPARTVQSQLEALSTVGAGNVSVTGGATSCSETNTTSYVVTFEGTLSGSEPGPLSATSALTGVSPSATVNESAAGRTADTYILVVTNIGGAPSTSGAVVRDTLPPGITATNIVAETVNRQVISCVHETLVCELPAIPSQETVAVTISVAPTAAGAASVINSATVEGGGALNAAITNASPNTVDATGATPFGLSDFSLDLAKEDGAASIQAAGHPYSLTATFDVDTYLQRNQKGEVEYEPVGNPKDIVVDLPLGLVGNPLATAERCPLVDMDSATPSCPASSRLGYAVLESNTNRITGSRGSAAKFSPIFNLVPERGYPAEFGAEEAGVVVVLYASVARTNAGYDLRVAVPSLTRALGIKFNSLTFFGDPAEQNGATSPQTAFLTNSADCASAPLRARIEANSWQEPESWVSAESGVYPYLDGCSLLEFTPALTMAPSSAAEDGTTQADEPSAYTTELTVPQKTGFGETATPELKDATVTLPEGVSVSPSAANGLQGCRETGPEGIDIPRGMAHPDEAGEGEEIGPDGLAHLAAGQCPAASTLGTAEVATPLLPSPLKGHVYLAQPKCGGEGQPSCTEASAANGELFGLYIEAAGEGVVVKLPGAVSANPTSGRLTATFDENPQLPFEKLTLHFNGGARAPLANPQSCGADATTSLLSAWSGQEVSEASPAFTIDWDGHGGACPASMPLAPAFTAGTVSAVAGGYSPLSVTFSRQDREQDLLGVQVKTPPGLLGMLSHVSLCGEPQAQQGTCASASQIGTTTVSAGSGEHPFYLGGRVYLTGPYNGAPFGLSVVVPAIAGPFNLGDVIVRAAINIDPDTAALTITSGPLPQIIDGVPTRLRTLNVTVNRPEFTFNATNCSAQQITATVAGAQGAKAPVSSSYAPSDCAGLPFNPSLTASTQARTSKADGASLTVKIAQKPGEANIQKVELEIPKQLPSRDSTLNKACLEAQFNENPAGCPPGSVIGTAKAVTPALNVPLTGPAILVSHGGAAFPDVEYMLQGQGVTIVLDGKTQIKGGITYSRFETVPDAPISSFETTLTEGPYSILGTYFPASAKGSTCGLKLVMPTIIVGQNGAQRTQNTKIGSSGCPPTVEISKTKIQGQGVLAVTLQASAAGKVRITGPGLKIATRRVKAGSQTFKLMLTKAGREMAHEHKRVPVTARLSVGKQAVSKTTTVRL